MCGVAGFLGSTGLWADDLTGRLAAMVETLAHRGPDADGLWIDVLFGSELRALRHHHLFTGRIEPVSVAAYLRSACVPAPHTIYRDTCKLPPGHLMSVRAGEKPTISCYWNLRGIAADGQRRIDTRDTAEVSDELEAPPSDAGKRQMVSADSAIGEQTVRVYRTMVDSDIARHDPQH